MGKFHWKIHAVVMVVAITSSVWMGCKPASSTSHYAQATGETMGTTYHVTYQDSLDRDFKPLFDSFLIKINQEVSTYIPTSTISQFNQADTTFVIHYDIKKGKESDSNKNLHFVSNYIASGIVYQQTNGYFDPTIMPLVNHWGFGYEKRRPITAAHRLSVDSLMQWVGFARVIRPEFGQVITLHKKHPDVQLDFSAIAKGHAVDVLATFLEANGVWNYMVEIGGEVRTRGKNDAGDWWRIGIQRPQEGVSASDFSQVLSLRNAALATSGNYRNYYEQDGQKYVHTINPHTGLPQAQTLLSASVFAKSCRDADAYATAIMVMGMDKAKQFLEVHPELGALLIYSDGSGNLQSWQSPNLSEFSVTHADFSR